MVSRYVPVSLKLIEEGNFLQEVEHEFAELQNQFIKHARQYSGKQTNKASINFTVNMIEKDGLYGIETEIKKKLPARPSVVTAAMADELQEGGKFALFAQSSGTSSGNPAQRTLLEDAGDEEELEEI